MERLYFWPAHPGSSLLVLWLITQVFFYAARVPMHHALHSFGRVLGGVFRLAGRWCKSMAVTVSKRDQEMLQEMGRTDSESKVAREFRRVEASYSKELARYPALHRKMDDILAKLDADYKECGLAPPTPPGWAEATAAVAKIPQAGDRVTQKILDELLKSAQSGEKKALQEFREVTAKRHKILGTFAPSFKSLQALVTETGKVVTSALESTKNVDTHMETYEKIRKQDAKAVRAVGWQSTQLFVVSLIVLGVAIGGAFVNFNLIALPMSELVPSGNRIGGMPVSTVAALVIVLMEVAAGIFAMEMLGVTGFFPKLEMLPASRRRIILGVSIGGLLLLASIESSLAILREQIVESGNALKQSLAGGGHHAVQQPAGSRIPLVGQAVLGFILPWILAMVAVPLETLISTGGHMSLAISAGLLGLGSQISRLLAHGLKYLFAGVGHIYDIYIVIPLQLERIVSRNGSIRAVPGTAKARP